MLYRKYAIPVILGACLGMILAGVQISATALNVALGKERPAGLVVIESVEESRLRGQVMGKDFTIRAPHAGELSAAALSAEARLEDLSSQAGSSAESCLKGLESLCRRAYGLAAGYLNQAFGDIKK